MEPTILAPPAESGTCQYLGFWQDETPSGRHFVATVTHTCGVNRVLSSQQQPWYSVTPARGPALVAGPSATTSTAVLVKIPGFCCSAGIPPPLGSPPGFPLISLSRRSIPPRLSDAHSRLKALWHVSPRAGRNRAEHPAVCDHGAAPARRHHVPEGELCLEAGAHATSRCLEPRAEYVCWSIYPVFSTRFLV